MATWVAAPAGSKVSPNDDGIEGFVVLGLRFQRIGKNAWFGECLELGTATNARTLNKTHDELVELVILHLNALEEAGERKQFFRDHNIAFHKAGRNLTAVSIEVPVANDDIFFHPQTVPLAKAA